MQKMNKAERAKIFMPFAALKGFEEALREKEKIIVEKRDLNDEELEDLNNIIPKIEKGMMIKLVYYSENEYIEIQGLVSRIDKVLKNLTVVNTKIEFENIQKIEIIE